MLVHAKDCEQSNPKHNRKAADTVVTHYCSAQSPHLDNTVASYVGDVTGAGSGSSAPLAIAESAHVRGAAAGLQLVRQTRGTAAEISVELVSV